ncbi:hypothetical protein [Chitinophaga sp.]|uniref:hypothetical protein n=1 Tax=Chitinophaga sp. TaxID=1869181 RepID=UPI0031D4BF8C
MKGIITLLICICFIQDGIGQQKSPKAVMPKKKEEKVAVKKKEVKKVKAPEKEKTPPKEEFSAPVEDSVVVVDSNLITPPEDTVPAIIPTPVPEPEVLQAGPDWQAWVSWVSMGLIIGMGVYVFISNSNIHRRLWMIERKVNKLGTQTEWEKTRSPAGITPTEVERLITVSPALKSIQDECATLKQHVEKLQQPTPRVIPVSNPVVPEESAGSTFYMTGPTGNCFPYSARSNHRENTVYKFYLQPGGTEARFELHTTGAGINEIIKVIESYIKPACDEENLPLPGTRNIITRKQGVAFLENDKWIIKTKAIIRYE